MGKNLHMQRRGRGTNAFRKPPNTFKADVVFPSRKVDSKMVGEVLELIDDPGHKAPLMRVVYEDNSETIFIAPEGIRVGSRIQEGMQADVTLGSVLPLTSIPDGTPVYNIEVTPGDGGKLARSAGAYATVVSHTQNTVSVLMPSKKVVDISSICRAQVGAVAGGGADAQPILRAGKSHHMHHAINAYWPRNRGVKSNPVDHPFGGKQHHKGASSMTSRHAPPGAKVGHIAARRVGRKKRS
ncbi:MAG: 50S ribosomal protein L2 [Candidatus Marsarchaeota archaeon]|nr:50S ribosomal protein L2 [Candidatus Marsarchaeota archaeon]